MSIGFYAGSFDPFTNGHLAVIKKSVKLFDKVIIGIGVNPNKKRSFCSATTMQEIITDVCESENFHDFEVLVYEGLTAEVATKSCKADFLIRGLRDATDYGYEENLAQINQKLYNIDTVFLRAGDCGFISSSLIRELIKHGERDICKSYVPKAVYDYIKV